IPGPLSSNVSLSPTRPPSRSDCTRMVPPPPWLIVLRASSLAAVTILVCSPSVKPRSTAHRRTTWRATTISFEERTGNVSSSGGAMTRAPVRQRGAKQLHALVNVEARAHPGQRQPQLDQRDGHGRPHADHDGLGIEDARHRGDVADHAADEGVHD